MRKEQVKVGGLYKANVGGRLTTVRVDKIDYVGDRLRISGGRRGRRNNLAYRVTNLATGCTTTFKNAAKFRREVTEVENRPDPTATSTKMTNGGAVQSAEDLTAY